jgi:putative ABC transport system ATP-binding protein
MIKMKGVEKTYHLGKTRVQALKGVDLEIGKGEMICIMGPSGSGKTTLLNLAGCLDQPDNGTLEIDSLDITKMNKKEMADIRSQKIGFIFQAFNLIPVLNIYENIEFPLLIKKEKLTSKEKEKRIMGLIEEVGLTDYIKHKPDELSGGQRQRVAIARALVTNPEIVFADEPTANLDSQTGQTILSLMRKLNKEEKTTFVFATHDPSITEYASNLYEMKDGLLNKKRG